MNNRDQRRMPRQRRLTTSRTGRLVQLGRLAGGIAAGALAEGTRQLADGKAPTLSSVLLTPANARKLTERLSEMRGAAMKIGQLLSMDEGHILPPELSTILASLREDAHQMPLGQVGAVLKREWGEDWTGRFHRFDFTPIAAASIGQVHQAQLKDGRPVAIKLQYPGVRESIDSDIDNVARLLRLSGLLPDGLDLDPLFEEARAQLHAEADYRQEAAYLEAYAQQLGDDPRFQVPAVFDELTTAATLGMAFMGGLPLDSLRNEAAALRNTTAHALLDLALREVFLWGLVQTDPNVANYRYDPDGGRIQLLDFGATRRYSPDQVRDLRQLLAAGMEGDDSDLLAAAVRIGYVGPDDPAPYRRGVIDLLRLVTAPLRSGLDFDFGQSGLAEQVRDQVISLRLEVRFTRLPPPPVLFLHRKLGGLYLILQALRARLPAAALARQVLASPTETPVTAPEQPGRREASGHGNVA